MRKIAVLGPKGTYCDVACKNYFTHDEVEVIYEPTIQKVAKHLNEMDIILPFENTLDGFVIESMDAIMNKNMYILDQMKLSIDFAFVSNAKDIKDVTDVYAQFKAYGQCLEFLSKQDMKLHTTQNNMESLTSLDTSDNHFGAIVPMHVLKDKKFNTMIYHVADSDFNETRFFLLGKNKKETELKNNLEASIVITALEDRPGILFEILKVFDVLDLNLKSIMSRPTKTGIGKYNFYIECALKKENIGVIDILKDIIDRKHFKVFVAGVYNKL